MKAIQHASYMVFLVRTQLTDCRNSERVVEFTGSSRICKHAVTGDLFEKWSYKY